MENFNNFGYGSTDHVLTPYGLQPINGALDQDESSDSDSFSKLISSSTSNSSSIKAKKIENWSSEPKDLLTEIKQALAQCVKQPTVLNLIYLKKLLEQYRNSLPCFFTDCYVDPAAIEANDYYQAAITNLDRQDQINLENLLESYHIPRQVTNLHLPEGIYTGSVLKGVPHGQGEFKIGCINVESAFELEFTLNGTFKENIFTKGKKIYPDNIIEKGFFKDNKLVKGFINEIYALNVDYKGGVYTGDWLNQQPHGIGTLTTAEGKTISGRFNLGKWEQEPIVPLDEKQTSQQIHKLELDDVTTFEKKEEILLEKQPKPEKDYQIKRPARKRASSANSIFAGQNFKLEIKVQQPLSNSNVITNSQIQNQPLYSIMVTSPTKDDQVKEVSLNDALQRSTKKIQQLCRSPAIASKEKVEKCLEQVIALSQGSIELLETSDDPEVAKQLVLSAKKLGSGISQIQAAREKTPNATPVKTNLMSKFSEIKESSKSYNSDSECGGIFSEEEDSWSYADEKSLLEEQAKIESAKRSKGHEEFFYDLNVYAKILQFRVLKDSFDCLRQSDNSEIFEKEYQEKAKTIDELLKKTSNLTKERLQEILSTFPSDELCILHDLFLEIDFSDEKKFYDELELSKRKIYLEEKDGWQKVFKAYASELGPIFEFLKESPIKIEERPYSPSHSPTKFKK